MGVLERIGKGLVSFGTGTPQIELDRMALENEALQTSTRANTATAGIREAALADIKREQAERVPMEGLRRRAAQGDQDARLELIAKDPVMAQQLLTGIGLNSDMQRAEAIQFAQQMLMTPPEMRAGLIAQRADNLNSQNRDPKDTMSLEGMTPEEQDFSMNALLTASGIKRPRTEILTGKKAVAAGYPEGSVVEQSYDGNNLTGAKVLLKPSESKQPIDDKTADNLKTEQGLRKEVNALLKDFFQVSEAYERVLSSAASPSAAGDLALIFNYMKMLDPGSTVREGEFATAQNSAGVSGRVVSLYNNLMRGERLNETQRADFLNQAQGLAGAAQNSAQKTANAYERIAENADVNVDNVLATFQERAIDSSDNETLLLNQARAAIAEGKDPEAVKQTLKEQGVDPSKL